MFSLRRMFGVLLPSFLAIGTMAMTDSGTAAPPDEARSRQQAQQLSKQGNWKEALAIFRRLAEDPAAEPAKVHESLRDAVDCLTRLRLSSDLDAFLQSVVEKHPNNWRALAQAAASILQAEHYGFVVSNTFRRGHGSDQSGVWVNVTEQDRQQALQWLDRALPLVEKDADPSATSLFYSQLAFALADQRRGQTAWLLQTKTPLDSLPNYTEIDAASSGYPPRFAPVDAEGKPIFYAKVNAWNDAANDGQRMRWAIDRWASKENGKASFFWAEFLDSQFGVETLASDSIFHRFQTSFNPEKGTEVAQTGVYALHSLHDHETIARLANGIQRFSLPDEFNPLRIYQQMIQGDAPTDPVIRQQAYHRLVNLFANRRQFPRAVALCRQAIEAKFNAEEFQQLLNSMIHPRGRFDLVEAQPAGKPATVGFVFRNANQASFTAAKVDVEKLLTDIKQFYRTHRPDQRPAFAGSEQFPPDIIDPSALFHSIKIERYLLGNVANWKLDLQPRENHWDRRIQVATPLQQPGLYVITAKMGTPEYVARCLVWIHDTAIVRKQLDNKILYFVADAVTGLPIPNANVEFFGFKHESNDGRRQPVKIANFAKKTSADGQLLLDASDLPIDYQWQVTARSNGRLALLGMEHLWCSPFVKQNYQQLKAYGISDRPAYRPGETIQAKFWVAMASYDIEDNASVDHVSPGRSFPIKLIDPQGTAIWTGTIETDRFGGGSIEVKIPPDGKLGSYRFEIHEHHVPTNLTVRVEEYRKPEFEVIIDAPSTPIQLGEKFTAKIRAKYYFGSPVVGAIADLKVTRTAFKDAYYPVRPFDWCYGAGYGWTAYDVDWYPGWRRWGGCARPAPWWLPRWHDEPPELVMQRELTLDENGEATFEIDSSTALAFQQDSDQRYKIEVEVRDASRRTLNASGEVIAAQQAFKIYSWCHQGFYQTGEKIVANFQARTLGGKGVTAQGKLELLRITYTPTRAPIENTVDSWELATDVEGNLTQTMKAGRPGQYRLKLTLRDEAGHEVEGGYLFTVRGENMQGADFRFSALELVPDKSEYTIGETLRLQISADRDDALVWLFVRPQSSLYPLPQKVLLQAKTAVVEIPVVASDQPNFFVEAITLYDGQFHQEAREIIVPPQKRVLDVEVKPSKSEYLPGEEAEVEIAVKGSDGEPVEGAAVLAVYDRSLEQIAPDALPPDIREFFWKWRRHHYPQSIEILSRKMSPPAIDKMPSADPLGIFGHSMADDADSFDISRVSLFQRGMGGGFGGGRMSNRMFKGARMESAMADGSAPVTGLALAAPQTIAGEATPSGGELAKPTSVRKDFADAAYWISHIQLDRSGKSIAKFKMPENLTSWQVCVWSMASGVRVGSGKAQALTRKNLMVRLQTPRFLVDRDEVIVSALVNNEFNDPVDVSVSLEQIGDFLSLIAPDQTSQKVTVAARGQQRIDWRCRAVKPGEAVLRVKALSVRESDATEGKLPIIVNGTLRTESFAGTIRADQEMATIPFSVPPARIIEQTKLTVRLSPSLAMAMVEALPYMVDYPHGCTEQTLNRFVPTVITHQTLVRLGIDLNALREKRNNLNAQELGDAAERAARWKRFDRNPVYDSQEVAKMLEVGLRRLTEMQLADGGWGWFSGLGEHSWPHTTAVVVRGLQAANAADAAIVPDCLVRGLDWLARYQAEQVQHLRNASTKKRPAKENPDDLDAFVFHVLVHAGRPSAEMQSFLYEKRHGLSVHGKSLLAIAVHRLGNVDQAKMLRQNIEQFLVEDAENETAYLRNESPWWYWYGSTIEATANYLKLLVQMEPKSATAPRLVKYLLNNRKHATYWQSTRDSALVVEAFADYLAATGEGAHDLTADVLLDGQNRGTIHFTPQNFFEVNNTIEVTGDAIRDGAHRLEIRRRGEGPLYWNVYQTNFTMEDEIAATGLEVKIDRRFYRLKAKKKELLMAGDRGQIGEGERMAYDRVPLADLDQLPSGQLVEVELLIESKNDYEYIMLRDAKAASMEPVDTNSGYVPGSGLSVYREFRDQYVGLFLRTLPRGSHSLRYRLRCEAPGRFTALPATIVGMYAPELVGNSADFDAVIVE